MAEHIARFRRSIRLNINGEEVRIERRARGRLAIIADEVGPADEKTHATNTSSTDAERRELEEHSTEELHALAVGLGFDPPANARRDRLIDAIHRAMTSPEVPRDDADASSEAGGEEE